MVSCWADLGCRFQHGCVFFRGAQVWWSSRQTNREQPILRVSSFQARSRTSSHFSGNPKIPKFQAMSRVSGWFGVVGTGELWIFILSPWVNGVSHWTSKLGSRTPSWEAGWTGTYWDKPFGASPHLHESTSLVTLLLCFWNVHLGFRQSEAMHPFGALGIFGFCGATCHAWLLAPLLGLPSPFFPENHHKTKGNSRFLKRTMVEKNGESTPRPMLVVGCPENFLKREEWLGAEELGRKYPRAKSSNAKQYPQNKSTHA